MPEETSSTANASAQQPSGTKSGTSITINILPSLQEQGKFSITVEPEISVEDLKEELSRGSPFRSSQCV